MQRPCEMPPRATRRPGAMAVEAALVLPVLMVVIFALLDLAIAAVQYNALAECARRGARAAIVRGDQTIAPSSPLGPAAWSGTAADAHPVALALRPSLICLSPNLVQVAVSWPDGGNRRGQEVLVVVKYEHRSLVATLGGGSWQLSATSRMPIVH